ncbi:MAG TPA: ribosome recycling factor [Candidatus Saccharimonadales bacterium]|nr:ribosome recycling factor [Candidatus Saccharimonadales bacterium]
MDVVSEAQQRMQKALDVLRGDLSTVRTGRATPTLVENITINAYGGSAKLKVMELSTIAVSDPQTILITPFDASIIGEIQKGIIGANVGLTPTIDGQVIRISIPPLSQERREELIHLMKQKLENGRIMIRQVRQEAMNDIKKQDLSEDETSRLEKEIQKTTDDTIEQIENLGKQKEQELLQI